MFALIANDKPTDGGYGLMVPGICLVLFDIIAVIVHGSVSYVKYRSVLKPHLVFVVSWFSFICVMLVSASEANAALLVAVRLCIIYLCFSLFGSLVTMIIFKVRNAIVKSKKAGIVQETEYIEDNLTALMKSKPSHIRSNKENASSEENTSKE